MGIANKKLCLAVVAALTLVLAVSTARAADQGMGQYVDTRQVPLKPVPGGDSDLGRKVKPGEVESQSDSSTTGAVQPQQYGVFVPGGPWSPQLPRMEEEKEKKKKYVYKGDPDPVFGGAQLPERLFNNIPPRRLNSNYTCPPVIQKFDISLACE